MRGQDRPVHGCPLGLDVCSKLGLVVDDLMEQQQVVIKSLETNYQQIEGLSGATILGDGTVVLIFDVPGLVHRCLQIRGQNQVESVA